MWRLWLEEYGGAGRWGAIGIFWVLQGCAAMGGGVQEPVAGEEAPGQGLLGWPSRIRRSSLNPALRFQRHLPIAQQQSHR